MMIRFYGSGVVNQMHNLEIEDKKFFSVNYGEERLVSTIEHMIRTATVRRKCDRHFQSIQSIENTGQQQKSDSTG